ncbi:hypothetical protein ACHWQZ_G002089 [Mnemiopsis leidyi]
MADSDKMLKEETEEGSPFVEKTHIKSSDDLIEELTRAKTWKYLLLVFSISLCWTASPATVYITSFAGIDPTVNDTWTCVSDKCFNLTSKNSSLLDQYPCDITEKVDGKDQLVFGPSDIEWDLAHTSFSVEFDLYCDVGSRQSQKTLLSSMYFPGALSGLLMGGYLFDHVGRRKSAMATIVLSFIVHLGGTFCHDFIFLLTIRFLQGFTEFLATTGLTILQFELMTANYRNLINGSGVGMWALGYPVVAAIGYFIRDWHYMFLATGILGLVCRCHVFFFIIESPRFYLVNNDVKTAKKTFEALAKYTTAELDLDNTEIVDVGKAEERDQSLKQQLRELIMYPSLLVETLLLMFLWFFIAMFFYGYNFGWGKLLPDRYLGYLMAGFGEVLAACLSVPVIHFLGRRRASMIYHVLAALIFLLLIPDVDLPGLGENWKLESVFSLFGITFVSGCFSVIYLWTGEVAPTSHRGFAFGVGSGSARIGSFFGPYIFNNLAPATSRAVPFLFLAAASFLCALAAFFLVETGDKEIPCVAGDVATRRKGYKYRL